MYAKCLQISDTRALVLGIGRVLLGLPQDLGEGQLHMLVYCFQQEVPEQREEDPGQLWRKKVLLSLLFDSEVAIFTHYEPAKAHTSN